MASPSPRSPVPSLLAAVVPYLFAASLATGLGWLLFRMVFEAQSQSYDTLIYARALWGLANGCPENSVLGVHSLAVHGSFVLYWLAPLTYVLPAAAVLLCAQVLSFAIVAVCAVKAGQRAVEERWGSPLTGLVIGLWFGALCCLLNPIVLNPFLADLRPDLIGVALVTVGLLRARSRRGFDVVSLILMAAAMATREEWAIVAAAGLVLAPASAEHGLRRRGRWVAALLCTAYFLLYWFVLRSWIGGAGVVAWWNDISREMSTAHDFAGETSIVLSRVEIALVVLFSAGGLALLGWRWVGAAVPGIVLLLVITRFHDLVLSFHYGLFAAPGLVVASREGLGRMLRWSPTRRFIAMVATTVLAVTVYIVAGAGPLGGRFRPQFFDLVASDGTERGSRFDHAPVLVEWHNAVRWLPSDAGAAVPYQVAAPIADREHIWTMSRLFDCLSDSQELPVELEWVGLEVEDWPDVGLVLVQSSGFHLAYFVDNSLALVTRDERFRLTAETVLDDDPPQACAGRSDAYLTAAGLLLCDVERATGALFVTAERIRDPVAELRDRSLVLGFVSAGDRHGEPTRGRVFGGLANLSQLPATVAVRVELGAVAQGPGSIIMVDDRGAAVPMQWLGAAEEGAGPILALPVP